MHLEAEFSEHRGFDSAGPMGLLSIGRVNHLDMVGFVARHHLIASNAIEHRMHNRPLWRCFTPTSLGFFLWQLHPFRNPPLPMELPTPHNHPPPPTIPR